MAYLEAAEGEVTTANQTDESEIIVQAGLEFNALYPWVVEQIKFLTKAISDKNPNCSWLFGKTVVVLDTVEETMPMIAVNIGGKRLAVVDDPSEEVLRKLIDEGYNAIALATEGWLSSDHRTKRYPDEERNNLEEALISLIDNDDDPFIDPDFKGQ